MKLKYLNILLSIMFSTLLVYGQSNPSSLCLEIFIRVKNAGVEAELSFECSTDASTQWGPDFYISDQYAVRELILPGDGGDCNYGWDLNFDCSQDPDKIGRNLYKVFCNSAGKSASIYVDARPDGWLANGDIHLVYDDDIDKFLLSGGFCSSYSGTELPNNTTLYLTSGGYNKHQPTTPRDLEIVNATGSPQLQWTASVPSVAKYHVYRNSVKITNNALTSNSYTDNGAYISANGEATYYKVQAVSGDETKTSPGFSNEVMCHTFGQGEEDMRGEKPFIAQFKQNIDDIYPNPFNPETMIRYSVAEEQNVNITVYDAAGKQVKVLLDAVKPKGEYEIRFNASHLSSGVYYCRMTSGRHSETKKIIL